jgi:glycine dehydrogenase subunit 2
MNQNGEPLLFEKSVPGRIGCSLPDLDVPEVPIAELIPQPYLRKDPPALPELSELDVVRHFTHLSKRNYGLDDGFYPLGSCTMKYNPKVNETTAGFAGFTAVHPLQPEDQIQGALELMHRLEAALKEITGMDRVTLQPAAGAQGEMAGILMIRAYHVSRGNPRRIVIIPDSAHGTNPATAALAGYTVQTVHSNAEGRLDVEDLRHLLNQDTAALMLTNPNTLGLFERDILKISKWVHDVGALLYMDGANLNALLGLCRPGDMGFDVVHSNLHKTFTVPHGGGGPGAGALGVKAHLVPFLPVPTIERDEKGFRLEDDRPHSIGKLHGFYGNFNNLVRAYTYIRQLGAAGLKEAGVHAVLNANYVRRRLEETYTVPYDHHCMHECVITTKPFRAKDVHAWDVAKRLLDYGFYAPTVNFPLIVEEALMIEPTETESKEMLDRFCDAMIAIAREVEENPDLVRQAPHTTPVRRVDEVTAARQLNLRWQP